MVTPPSKPLKDNFASAREREVVLSIAVSLDGYIARPDGLWMDREIDMRAFLRSIDVIVAGRKTLDGASGQGGGDKSMAQVTCYVFSRTKEPGKRNGVEYVNRAPSELVRQLKKRPGRNIWLMGGGELTREFLNEDLLDRMELAIMPVLLGKGIPLFPEGSPQRNFQLVNQRSYSSGIVLLSYRRAISGRSVRFK